MLSASADEVRGDKGAASGAANGGRIFKASSSHRDVQESSSRRSSSKGNKTDADVALETLVGHEIYVYGTGSAREVRRDGFLRKV